MNWKVFWSALGIGALLVSLSLVLAVVGMTVEHLTGSSLLGRVAIVGLIFGGLAALSGVLWDRA